MIEIFVLGKMSGIYDVRDLWAGIPGSRQERDAGIWRVFGCGSRPYMVAWQVSNGLNL